MAHRLRARAAGVQRSFSVLAAASDQPCVVAAAAAPGRGALARARGCATGSYAARVLGDAGEERGLGRRQRLRRRGRSTIFDACRRRRRPGRSRSCSGSARGSPPSSDLAFRAARRGRLAHLSRHRPLRSQIDFLTNCWVMVEPPWTPPPCPRGWPRTPGRDIDRTSPVVRVEVLVLDGDDRVLHPAARCRADGTMMRACVAAQDREDRVAVARVDVRCSPAVCCRCSGRAAGARAASAVSSPNVKAPRRPSDHEHGEKGEESELADPPTLGPAPISPKERQDRGSLAPSWASQN